MRIQNISTPCSGRPGGRTCSLLGCNNNTREQKPYCSEHLELNAYAGKVIQELREMEAEDERVSRLAIRGNEAIHTLNAQEIVNKLRHEGERTVKGLAKDLNLDLRIVWAYIRALTTKKVVIVGTTDRGDPKVSLNPELR